MVDFGTLYGILALACTALLVASATYVTVRSCKALYLYVTDGADTRAPILLSFCVVYVVCITATAYSIFTGTISGTNTMLVQIVFFSLLCQLVRGRFLSFPSINISKNTRFAVWTIVGIVYVAMVVVFVLSYKTDLYRYSYSVIHEEQIVQVLKMLLSDVSVYDRDVLTSRYFLMVVMYGVDTLLVTTILWFDLSERRSSKTIKYDCLLYFSILVFFAATFLDFSVDDKYFWLPLITIFAATQVIIFLNVNKEVNSVIKRSSVDMNSNVKMVKDLLEELSRAKPTTRERQVKRIARIVFRNEALVPVIRSMAKKKYKKLCESILEETSSLKKPVFAVEECVAEN